MKFIYKIVGGICVVLFFEILPSPFRIVGYYIFRYLGWLFFTLLHISGESYLFGYVLYYLYLGILFWFGYWLTGYIVRNPPQGILFKSILVTMLLLLIGGTSLNVYKQKQQEQTDYAMDHASTIADIEQCTKEHSGSFNYQDRDACYARIIGSFTTVEECTKIPNAYLRSCATAIRWKLDSIAPCNILKNPEDLYSCYFASHIPKQDQDFIRKLCPTITIEHFREYCQHDVVPSFNW